jgi:hypothetical protein
VFSVELLTSHVVMQLNVVARKTGKTAGGKKTVGGRKTGKGTPPARKTVRERAGWWGKDSSLGQFYGPERGLWLGKNCHNKHRQALSLFGTFCLSRVV